MLGVAYESGFPQTRRLRVFIQEISFNENSGHWSVDVDWLIQISTPDISNGHLPLGKNIDIETLNEATL